MKANSTRTQVAKMAFKICAEIAKVSTTIKTVTASCKGIRNIGILTRCNGGNTNAAMMQCTKRKKELEIENGNRRIQKDAKLNLIVDGPGLLIFQPT